MATGRIKKNKSKSDYTVIPNAYLRNKELTWKAKGLLTYLLSMSEDWQVFKSDLTNRSKDGYESMLSAWKELENSGYIETVRLKKGNLFAGYDYVVHDTPVLGVLQTTETRVHGNPELISNIVNSIEQVTLESLNLNAELKNSASDDKKSSSVKAKKEKGGKRKEDSAHHRIIKHFFEVMHTDFVFAPIHAKSVTLLIANATKLLTKHNRLIDDDSISDFVITMLSNLPDYYADKDLAVINSKFNEIISEIKNKANGKPRTTAAQQTRDDVRKRWGSRNR